METEIFDYIHSYGTEHHNPAIVEKYQRYFKEGYDAYGLGKEQVDTLVQYVLAQPGMNPDLIHSTTLALVAAPKYEMTVISIRLLLEIKKSWTSDTFKTLEQWFSAGITNWAQTDYICGELMNLLFKKGLVTLASLEPWRTAENKFQRRAAVVSLIKPMKLSADFAPWFGFIEPMMHDPERVVQQGLGWFLREAWKKQPGFAEPFLLKYKNTAPRLIYQYATERMTPEGKEKFRKEKI